MSSTLRIAALAAACAVAGCGSASSPAPDAERPILNRGPSGHLTPPLPRHPLVDVQMLGDQTGTSDKIVFGRDGRAVIVRAYGGGGFYSYQCALSPRELAAVRAAVGGLPLGRPPKRPKAARKSYYQQYPATFVVRAGRYTGSFTADAVPRDGRWFVTHVKRMLHGQEGHCRETFGTRSR